MQSLHQLLDKQLENPSLEQVLESCRNEGIPENEIVEVLDTFLNKVQAQKRSVAYWEKVQQETLAMMPKLNSAQMKNEFLRSYHSRFAQEFILDEFSEPLIDLLCLYFTNDPKAEDHGLSLRKGILLHGGVGTGKSSIMTCFVKNQRQSFKMINCLDVSAEYSRAGYDGLKPFVLDGSHNRFPREYWQQPYFTWCFDDLGVEREKKYFGNEVNVMAEAIQMIYDKDRLTGNIHLTTNLGAEQVKEVYGQRVASRLREMVNVIEIDPKAPDRRS